MVREAREQQRESQLHRHAADAHGLETVEGEVDAVHDARAQERGAQVAVRRQQLRTHDRRALRRAGRGTRSQVVDLAAQACDQRGVLRGHEIGRRVDRQDQGRPRSLAEVEVGDEVTQLRRVLPHVGT